MIVAQIMLVLFGMSSMFFSFNLISFTIDSFLSFLSFANGVA
jgi:hypothetical protein